MKLVSGIIDSGFFAQSALSAEVATKDSLGRNISETYLTAVDIPESANWNSTYNTVSANSAQWAGGTANPQIPVTGINGIKISESGDKVVFEVSGDYYPGNNPSGFITGVDLSDYATTAQVSEKLDTTAFSTVSGDFLTAVDLTPYQEKADMTAYATVESLTAKQDAGDYLSATDSANFLLTSDSGNFYPMNQNPSGYLTAHQSLADYQTTAGMTAYLTTGDSAEFMTTAERSDYIPTGVSSEFYTTANTAGYISTIPDTYLQNTDLSTEDGKVTAISGIPLSAGGDVPEGVMVESGLEYNAVQEISGYNGSAIAQYGAEKQWLTHDDTIVHVSNSAQYAFGVNLSGISADLARMMGVDETVLYSGTLTAGTAPTAYQLSEPISAFDRYRIYWLWNVGTDNAPKISEYFWDSNRPAKNNFCLSTDERAYGTNYSVLGEFVFASNLIDITYNYSMQGNDTANKYIKIQRIVGIGRKN